MIARLAQIAKDYIDTSGKTSGASAPHEVSDTAVPTIDEPRASAFDYCEVRNDEAPFPEKSIVVSLNADPKDNTHACIAKMLNEANNNVLLPDHKDDLRKF